MLRIAKTISPWMAPTWWRPRSEPAAAGWRRDAHPRPGRQSHPNPDRDDLRLRLV